jgi:phage-related minor tail protein
MAIQLGSAYGKVSIDSSGVSAGVGSATKSLQNLSAVGTQVGDAMQSVGRSLTVGLTLPILAVGAASIKAASDLDESLNKVNVVFGESSKEIIDWSKNAATSLGQSQQQALEATGTFGNLFTTMGLGHDTSAQMSMDIVQLASDLASFNNISPDEALLKLRAGLVGEAEPLRTLGVNLTAAAVKAKAMEMGLAGANGELSQAALVQARYALIMEQTANAQGDFARTSDGLANSSRIMKAEMADAAAKLGTQLLPMALMVVKGLNRLLEAFNNLPPFVQKGIVIFLGLLAVLGPIIGMLGTLISFVSTIAGLATTLGGLGISITAIGTALGSLVGVIFTIGAALLPIVLPLLLIAATVYLVYLAFKNNFGGITTTVKQLWEIIKYYFSLIGQRMLAAFKNINWAQIGKFILMGIANGMLGGIPLMVAAAYKAGQAALTAIKKALGIASPSKEFMKLGDFSAQGYAIGLSRALDPNTIAKSISKPVQSTTSNQQQNINMQFASGLTVRQVESMLAQNNQMIMSRLGRALGGA